MAGVDLLRNSAAVFVTVEVALEIDRADAVPLLRDGAYAAAGPVPA